MKKFLIEIIVLFSIVCFAKPINSMLGANGIFASTHSNNNESSAKLYVQDGLVSMFDGIETRGYGKTQFGNMNFDWVDCITGNSISFSTQYISTKDGFASFVKFTGFNIPIPEFNGEWTIEYVATMPPISSGISFIRGNLSTKSFYPILNSGSISDRRCQVLGGSYGYQLFSEYENDDDLIVVSFIRTSTTHKVYLCVGPNEVNRNCDLSLTTIPSTYLTFADYTDSDSSGLKHCRIKCIRFYNRPLIDEERLHNLSIDRMRFNSL